MQWLESPYPVALLIAATLSATLAFVAWRRRRAPGATPLIVLASAVAIWQAGYAFETASVSVAAKILWAKVEYFGIVTVSTAWLAVTIQYSSHGEWALAPRAADLAKRTQSLSDLEDTVKPRGANTGAEYRSIIEAVQELAQDSAALARRTQALTGEPDDPGHQQKG